MVCPFNWTCLFLSGRRPSTLASQKVLQDVGQDFVDFGIMGPQVVRPDATEFAVPGNQRNLVLDLLLLHAGVQEHLTLVHSV